MLQCGIYCSNRPIPDSSALKDTTKLPPTDSIGIPKGETNELHKPGHNMYGIC